jgi:F0F1-type ATP synthase membrane subunit a
MMKLALTSTALFFVTDLLACPYCAGSTQSGKDTNTTLVLALFILATYIPYTIIYRLIKKHRALKEAHDSSGSANP